MGIGLRAEEKSQLRVRVIAKKMVLAKDVDLEERKKVHDRNSDWMVVICENCLKRKTVLRRSQDVVGCPCGIVLLQPPPTGGLAIPTEACTLLDEEPIFE